MNEWKWYAGPNEEFFSEGPFDTKDQAISAGADSFGESFHILEAIKEPILLSNFIPDGGYLLEWADEAAMELGDPDSGDPIFDLPQDKVESLTTCVKEAVNRWQAEQGLVFMPWVFSHTRNEEYIELPETVV